LAPSIAICRMSQTSRLDRYSCVNATSGAVPGGTIEDNAVVGDSAAEVAAFDLDAVFRAQFARMARVITRVVQAMPVTLLIDRNGKIAVTHVGLVTKSQYQSEITALLAEKANDKVATGTALQRQRPGNS
jgi:hypothetical protein